MDSRWFGPTALSSSMGAAALAFPWESTPLGAMSTWGESLRQSARMCFSTKFPVMFAWGPELTMVYNDAYREMLGTNKRLSALGAPLAEVWDEVWEDIGPLVEHVMTTRLPTWSVDTPLMMNRSGFLEETFFTFSYSPLVDDVGEIVGILDISTETTTQVVSQRRLTLIDALYSALQQSAGTTTALAQAAVDILGDGPDIGRCALVLRTADPREPVVVGDHELAQVLTEDALAQALLTSTPTITGSTIALPLTATHRHGADGVLVVEAPPTRPFDASLRSFVMLAASAITGALRSATVQQAQLDYFDARARLSELEATQARESSITLQHSLLTPPPEPNHLHLVVRYQPAARDLEIGGDWYDAFLTKDGATTVVIGDVTGHDHHAAAAMGQLRGLIRAIAFDSGQPPAAVLGRTDDAVRGLNLDSTATATAIVARIEQSPGDRSAGVRTVRWSNAGHPHPILVRADGTIEVLSRKNDLLLGILVDVERTEHEVELQPMDTLFLYTDGLVERRHVPLAQSTATLVAALEGAHERTLDEVADHVLATLAPDRAADDIALVLVRPYPEDRPRPSEAGPARNVPDTVGPPPGG